MQKYNFLFYHTGGKKDYIPSREIYSIKNRLKDFIHESYVVDTIDYDFTSFSKDEFIHLYNNIDEFEKIIKIDISKFKIDYFISNNRWFNESIAESILISKLLKKLYGTKTIFVGEFNKYYYSFFVKYYSEEIDFYVDGGSSMHLQEEDIISIIENGEINGIYIYDEIDGYKQNPDFSLIYGKTNIVEYEISRGCKISPRCFYCGASKINSGFSRSINMNIEVLKHLRDNGIKKLYFTDSEINFDNKYLTTFLDSCIENNLFFLSSAYLLAKDLDEELINKMSKFGIKHVRIGVETINFSRSKIISKRINNEELQEIIKLLKKYGILVQLHFIFGFKGETSNELMENIHFLKNNLNYIDYADFYYLKFRPKNSVFNNHLVQKFDLPFVKDNLYFDKIGKVRSFFNGDNSEIDKKNKLLNGIVNSLGKKSVSPKEFFDNYTVL